MSKKLHHAKSLYLEGIQEGFVRSAAVKYTGERFTQHHPGIREGVEGFVIYYEDFVFQFKERKVQFLKAFEDGSHVFLCVLMQLNQGESYQLSYVIFDTNDQDLLIEQWELTTAITPETMTLWSSDQCSLYKAFSNDQALTNQNKCLVREFLCHVMVLGNGDLFGQYLNLNDYQYYGPLAMSDIENMCGHYDHVVKLIGANEWVVSLSRTRHGNIECSRMDIFRIENALIDEHWTHHLKILPKEAWVNSGPF